MKATMVQYALAMFHIWIIIATVLDTCSSNPVRFSQKNAKCIYDNSTYSAGEKFRPEPCTFCKCPRHGGRVQCGIQDCQYMANCVRYEKEDNECCGRCAQLGCKHSDGKIYHPGALISAAQCERCYCPDDGGRIQCKKVPCPDLTCVDPVHDEGHCCPRCPNGSNCWLNGKVIDAGQIVLETECKICQCNDGPMPGWMMENTEPRAICFVLTSKEKKGCPDEDMMADQAVLGETDSFVPHLLHNDHKHRKILYQKYLHRNRNNQKK